MAIKFLNQVDLTVTSSLLKTDANGVIVAAVAGTDYLSTLPAHTHTIANVTGLQAALDLKAPLDSPALTGTPTAPTAAIATNTTQIATTAYVKAQGYLTSVTNVNGYAGTLLPEDNRTISPSELTANRLKFGFTSWTNNNAAPYADFLHFRSYSDASGGNENLVMFRKDAIGMRIWQQAWGSATAYSSFKDVAFTDSSITGNAATATILATARTLTIGATGKTFNGSADVAWTLTEIGAQAAGSYAAASHTHDDRYYTETESDSRFLNTSGDTSTGMQIFYTSLTNNDDWQNSPISIMERGQVGTTQSALQYAPNLNFHWSSRYSKSLWTDLSGVLRFGEYNASGVPQTDGTIAAATFSGALSGNATTSTTLATARTLTIGNTGKTFNGSANVDWTLAEIGAQAVLTNPVTGTGTTNYLPKLTGATTIGNSQVFDNGTNVGIGTATPQRKLEVKGTGIVASFGGTFSPASFAGVHFGYSEANASYKKSALVFERTDNHGQGGNASGKIHFLLNNVASGSADSLSHSVMVIDTDSVATQGSARVGIAKTNPATALDVNGVITATGGTSTNWNTAFGWGNHAGLYLGLNSKAADSELLDGQDSTGFFRAISGIAEAGKDTLVTTGFTNVLYTGYDSQIWNVNSGGSTGTVQVELEYNTPVRGFKIRNKTDNTTWSSVGWVVMTVANQGHINGTLLHSNNFTTYAAAAAHTHTIANVTGLQTALDAKAPLDSPALTGTPTAPTAATVTNTTQIATTAFVKAQGYLTSIPTPVNGDWWNGGFVSVATDGVMEMGKYMDFHTADSGGNTDFDLRVTVSPNLFAVGGVVSATGGTSTDWNTAYGWSNHAEVGYWLLSEAEAIQVDSNDVTFIGNVTVQGTFTESSSIKFKENITPLEPSLAKVNQLEPVNYNKVGVEVKEIGLIAEQVATLFPEVVTYNNDGEPEGIQYQRLSVILLKAVQELTERVNKLENK
jgi:hypothetical protein